MKKTKKSKFLFGLLLFFGFLALLALSSARFLLEFVAFKLVSFPVILTISMCLLVYALFFTTPNDRVEMASLLGGAAGILQVFAKKAKKVMYNVCYLAEVVPAMVKN